MTHKSLQLLRQSATSNDARLLQLSQHISRAVGQSSFTTNSQAPMSGSYLAVVSCPLVSNPHSKRWVPVYSLRTHKPIAESTVARSSAKLIKNSFNKSLRAPSLSIRKTFSTHSRQSAT